MSIHQKLFSEIKSPAKDLFYIRNDPDDKRMGEFVQWNEEYYDNSDIIIIGCPQDIGVRRNKGRPGTANGPVEIRRSLYRFPVPENLRDKLVVDIGDINTDMNLEEIHQILMDTALKILKDGKQLIVLGGGNDISYPDCKALSEISDDMLVFNIDSHFDVREDERTHSGTPYRQLLEEEFIHPPKFYELANKKIANSPAHDEYLRRKGVNIYNLSELRKNGISKTIEGILSGEKADSIFWGFDMDSVRAVDAPGVSAPYPVGLTAEEICEIAVIAGNDNRSRVLEISELNPRFDVDSRTSKLAAMIILYFMNG
ncbi:MAG: arginase [candidate division Zixibacteria bacterium]|nr:arginase [candidate division Zixibacteria bacterium]